MPFPEETPNHYFKNDDQELTASPHSELLPPLGRFAIDHSSNASPLLEQLHPAELSLFGNLSQLVHKLDPEKLLIAAPERTIINSGAFRFTALKGTRHVYESLDASGFGKPVDDTVKTTYRAHPLGRPYLDTAEAIGLVYANHLIAVAGAGVDQNGKLFITQIQDVTGVRRERGGAAWKRYTETGLQQGCLWRDTLVSSWERVATEIGAQSVIVRSHHNSTWIQVQRSGCSGYDDVAQRMGYIQDTDTRNWVKKLQIQPA